MSIKECERRIEFEPAYDKRSDDPKKNYGIHGVTLRMILFHPIKGSIQFVLYTNWHLPHVTNEMKDLYGQINGDYHWRERPLPVDVGYHALTPQYEGHTKMLSCHLYPETSCYYDGSSLDAYRIYEVLLNEGSDGIWRELENRWIKVFSPEVSSC